MVMASVFLQQAISGCQSTATRREVGVGLFSQVTAMRQALMTSSCVRKGSVCVLGIISSQESSQALAQVAQGGVEPSSIEGIRNHGDVAPRAAVIGHSGAALGRGILEVLSNLSDSMILCKKGNVGRPFVVVWLGSSFVLPMEAFQIRAGF